MKKIFFVLLVVTSVLTGHIASSGSNPYGAGSSHRSWGRGKYLTNSLGGGRHSSGSGQSSSSSSGGSWMAWFRRTPEDFRRYSSPDFSEELLQDVAPFIPTTTVESSSQVWVPAAVKIAPEPITTTVQTTTGPYYLAYNVKVLHDNGTYGYKYLRVAESYNDPNGKNHDGMVHKIPRSYFDTTKKPFEMTEKHED